VKRNITSPSPAFLANITPSRRTREDTTDLKGPLLFNSEQCRARLLSCMKTFRTFLPVCLDKFSRLEQSPSFSHSSELLLSHLLYFDNHLNCPGGGGTQPTKMHNRATHLSSFQSLGHSLPKAGIYPWPRCYKEAPFGKRPVRRAQKKKRRVSWRRRRWRERQKQTRTWRGFAGGARSRIGQSGS